MTKPDRITLLHFVAYIGMYIHAKDEFNIASFITGYECGSAGKCGLTQLLRELLSRKYKIQYDERGWPGQIKCYAEKFSISWVMAFKKSALEVIIDMPQEELDVEMKKIIKSRITELIKRIDVAGDPWFNDNWKEEWQSLCSTKSKRLKQLWSKQEWEIIKAIDKESKEGQIFLRDNIPTVKMANLKQKFVISITGPG